MNEFASKKLGEVLAFEKVSLEIATKAVEAINSTFGNSFSEELNNHSQKCIDEIDLISEEMGVMDVVGSKAEKTGDKLRSMQDLYLQKEEDWEDPAEIMEWLGFFEGAAIVHWSLVRGVSSKLNNEKLKSLAQEGVSHHKDFLNKVEEKISEYASENV